MIINRVSENYKEQLINLGFPIVPLHIFTSEMIVGQKIKFNEWGYQFFFFMDNIEESKEIPLNKINIYYKNIGLLNNNKWKLLAVYKNIFNKIMVEPVWWEWSCVAKIMKQQLHTNYWELYLLVKHLCIEHMVEDMVELIINANICLWKLS